MGIAFNGEVEKELIFVLESGRTWRSSVNIVPDYKLDYRTNVFRSPAEAKPFLFSLLCLDQL
jgi:hypothetical protein